jgi:hypothetical protein
MSTAASMACHSSLRVEDRDAMLDLGSGRDEDFERLDELLAAYVAV